MAQYNLQIGSDYNVTFDSYQDALNTLLNKFSPDSNLTQFIKELLVQDSSFFALTVLNTKLEKYEAFLEPIPDSSSEIVLNEMEKITVNEEKQSLKIEMLNNLNEAPTEKEFEYFINMVKNLAELAEFNRQKGIPFEIDTEGLTQIYQELNEIEITEKNSEELTSFKTAVEKLLK